jgi:hypothetical protein
MVQGTTPVPDHAVYAAFSMRPQFVPDTQLDEQGLYTVVITGGITSISGQPLAPFQWTFHTGADTAPPRVRSSMPADAATGIPKTTNIEVVFDEPVTGVDAASLTVSAGGPTSGSVAAFDARTYTFVPAAALPAAATITVTAGPPIHDAHGNMMSPATFSFTTAP